MKRKWLYQISANVPARTSKNKERKCSTLQRIARNGYQYCGTQTMKCKVSLLLLPRIMKIVLMYKSVLCKRKDV